MNSDDREAVDDEEQHDDDADDAAGASEEQPPGPSVGLYLKDNMLQYSYLPASTCTLLSPFLKRFCTPKLDLTSHDISRRFPKRRAV